MTYSFAKIVKKFKAFNQILKRPHNFLDKIFEASVHCDCVRLQNAVPLLPEFTNIRPKFTDNEVHTT